MTATLTLTKTDGTVLTLTRAVNFRFEKERYRPYTLLSGKFVGECEPAEIARVDFYVGGRLLHSGTADLLICTRENDADLVSLRSFSFSKQLGQNESEPGIITSPNLETIINYANVVGVDVQANTDTTNYVYINERTTVWEAVRVYAMKAYGTHPFIRGTNTVSVSVPLPTAFTYSPPFVSTKKGLNLSTILSDVYTNDLNGDWIYHLHNDFASDHNIAKEKYAPRDREWLYDLTDELRYYMDFSNRGRQFAGFTYCGCLGEDLCDKANVSALSLSGAEIDKITVSGDCRGIFTSIECYI